jgi:hypothetical protein
VRRLHPYSTNPNLSFDFFLNYFLDQQSPAARISIQIEMLHWAVGSQTTVSLSVAVVIRKTEDEAPRPIKLVNSLGRRLLI